MKTRHHLLTQPEELALIARAQKGDEQATLQLVEVMRGLVCKLARKRGLQSAALDLDDLIEYGILGLLKAIENYNPQHRAMGTGDRPPRLSTYATRCIAGEIDDAIEREMFTIRPPRGVHTPGYQILPLNEPVRNGRGEMIMLADTLPDPFEFEEDVLFRCSLRSVLKGMPDPRWPELIVMRFGLDGRAPKPYHQLGKAMGLPSWTARTETLRAIRWLRQHLTSPEATLGVGSR